MRFVHVETPNSYSLQTKAVHPFVDRSPHASKLISIARQAIARSSRLPARLCRYRQRSRTHSTRSRQPSFDAIPAICANLPRYQIRTHRVRIAIWRPRALLPSVSCPLTVSPESQSVVESILNFEYRNLFEIKGTALASINNSLCFTAPPIGFMQPRLLVSTNDEQIDVYTIFGDLPNFPEARRRRERRRRPSITAPPEWSDQEAEDEQDCCSSGLRMEKIGPSIKLGTPVNHSQSCRNVLAIYLTMLVASVSPNGRYMVSVGDDNLIRIFSVGKSNGDYTLIKTVEGTLSIPVNIAQIDWCDQAAKMRPSRQIGPRIPFRLRSEARTAS